MNNSLQNKYKFYPLEGYVSKLTASLVYKASKGGYIKVLPEFPKYLYDAVERESGSLMAVARQRYNSDFRFYDNLNDLTLMLLDKQYKEAQKLIDEIQNDLIKHASKRSPFFKYQKGMDSSIEKIADMLDEEGWEERTLNDDTAYYRYDDYTVSAHSDLDEVSIREDGDIVWEGTVEEFLKGAVIKGYRITVNGKKII